MTLFHQWFHEAYDAIPREEVKRIYIHPQCVLTDHEGREYVEFLNDPIPPEILYKAIERYKELEERFKKEQTKNV